MPAPSSAAPRAAGPKTTSIALPLIAALALAGPPFGWCPATAAMAPAKAAAKKPATGHHPKGGPAKPAAPDSNQFASVAAGVSVRKPASWRFMTRDQVLENRTRVRMKDADWDSLMQTRAALPLVVMTKHPEPFESLNPSCGITARPLGSLRGQSANSLLNVIASQLEGAFKDYKVVAPIESTQVSGFPAAKIRFTYTLTVEGHGDLKALSRLFVVPRGSVLFILGQGGPAEGPDVSEEEFAKILETVKIDS